MSQSESLSMPTALRCLIAAAVFIALGPLLLSAAEPAIPILVYHRFGPVRADSMTVTTPHFKEQMSLLQKNNFTVIPLEDVVAWRLGKHAAPPPKSVVVTFDDGHLSVYREARPIVVSKRIPVTLFIYPSCISHASYAMTWEQLSQLAATPFFTVQSHTYWHPNFKQEAKKQDHAAYVAFVDTQLKRSKAVLEARMNRPINLLAWPFGIYDPYLLKQASADGYEAGFSIDRRLAKPSDPIMALPRCLILDEDVGPRFLRLIDPVTRNAHN